MLEFFRRKRRIEALNNRVYEYEKKYFDEKEENSWLKKRKAELEDENEALRQELEELKDKKKEKAELLRKRETTKKKKWLSAYPDEEFEEK